MTKPLVAVLSGAGISTDSGIPDYRGPGGLWRRDPEAEKLVTYDYYMGDPEIRRRSWQMRRQSRTLQAEPNAAHLAVVELERAGVPVRVITQNVDGLHQLAGMPARKVLELHGTAREFVCTECHARGPDGGRPRPGRGRGGRSAVSDVRRDPQVGDGDVRSAPRPGRASATLSPSPRPARCSSPSEAASRSSRRRARRCRSRPWRRLVVVNAEPTPYDDRADEVVREPIGTALPQLLRRLRESEAV